MQVIRRRWVIEFQAPARAFLTKAKIKAACMSEGINLKKFRERYLLGEVRESRMSRSEKVNYYYRVAQRI